MASTKIKTLVCFYSLDGNTRHIAKAIQQKVDADLLELRIKSPYKYKGFFYIGVDIGNSTPNGFNPF
jgi:flavodoxin